MTISLGETGDRWPHRKSVAMQRARRRCPDRPLRKRPPNARKDESQVKTDRADDMLNDPGAKAGFSVLALYARFRHHLMNFTAFTALQAASYLIPIVTIPYFARTLGIGGLGQIAIAGAAGQAAAVLMDYGILLSGPRFAAKNADDPPALNAYLDATSMLKTLVLMLVLAILWPVSLALPSVSEHFWIFFWSMISAAAMCLFPQWLFQGLLIMPVAARILVVTRVTAAIAALALTRSPSDAFVVPMSQALGGIVALAAAAFFLKRRYGIHLRRSERTEILGLVRSNWKLFSATAWGATHTHGSIVFMGIFLPATSIGFYSIAQRISQAFVSIFNIAAQTGFPSFVRAHARQSEYLAQQVRTYLQIVCVCAATCLIGMYVLREPLYRFFAGKHSDLGVAIFSIWLFASFFTVISVSLSPLMVALHLDSRMASVYRITGIGFIVLAPIATIYLGAVGVALATLFPECFMAIYCLVVVSRALRRTDRRVPQEGGKPRYEQ